MSLFDCTDIDYVLLEYLCLTKYHQIMFVNKYYYELFNSQKSRIVKKKIDLASKIIKEMIQNYGINYEEFLSVITNNGGCITGPLIYYAICQAFGIDCDFKYASIKIIVNDDKPIENYIEKNINFTGMGHKFNCYKPNMLYAKKRVLKNKFEINYYLIKESIEKFIEDFPIDCCKIIHTKNFTRVHDINNFIARECYARFNIKLMNFQMFDGDSFYRCKNLLDKYRDLCDYYNYFYRSQYVPKNVNKCYSRYLQNKFQDIYEIIKTFVPDIETIFMTKYGYDIKSKIGYMIKVIEKIKKYETRGMKIKIVDE